MAPPRHMIPLMLLAIFCGACATIETRTTPTVGPQSSWEEIRGTSGLALSAPMIPFGARDISVTSVCRSGDRLRATAADGTALETPAVGHRSSYMVEVGTYVVGGDGTYFRRLFAKPFEVPPCP